MPPEAERMIGEVITEYHGVNGERIEIVSMHLVDITIPDFQRERKPHVINKIVAEFDLTAYFAPVVAEFGKKFICLDGQQRLAACERMHLDLVTVAMITGIANRKRLAAIYLHINRDRKLLSAFEKFMGALGAEDRGSLDIDEIVTSYHLTMAASASMNGQVPAGAVAKIHELGGKEHLNRVLFVKEAAWGHQASREANESRTLLGLSMFLRRHGDRVDDNRLIAILNRYHPNWILSNIDPFTKLSRQASYSELVREEYNKGGDGVPALPRKERI